MKKTLSVLSTVTFLLASCGGSNSPSKNSNEATTVTPQPKTTMDAGELLIVKSDCVGCHNKENKIIGPSYLEIAAKYPLTDKNITYLADKILNGGKGVWGTIPMSPHPQLSQNEAKQMAKYILSLR